MTAQETSQAQAQFAALTARAEALNQRRTQVQVQLEAARQQLAAAEAEAKTAFGTADLDELREKLREAEHANAKVIADFEAALNTLEAHLNRMERALTDPEFLNELLLEMGRAPGSEPQVSSESPDAAQGDTAELSDDEADDI